MTIPEFISRQPADRQELLAQIHQVIIDKDGSVTASIEPMMGKEMIIYKAGIFKYGLASMKNHMSLHAMPIYGVPALYARYQPLLPKAVFQKGCINFKTAEDMPLAIVKKLLADCAKVDLAALRDQYMSRKKS